MDELKFVWTEYGVHYVLDPGVLMMPEFFVDNLDFPHFVNNGHVLDTKQFCLYFLCSSPDLSWWIIWRRKRANTHGIFRLHWR